MAAWNGVIRRHFRWLTEIRVSLLILKWDDPSLNSLLALRSSCFAGTLTRRLHHICLWYSSYNRYHPEQISKDKSLYWKWVYHNSLISCWSFTWHPLRCLLQLLIKQEHPGSVKHSFSDAPLSCEVKNCWVASLASEKLSDVSSRNKSGWKCRRQLIQCAHTFGLKLSGVCPHERLFQTIPVR